MHLVSKFKQHCILNNIVFFSNECFYCLKNTEYMVLFQVHGENGPLYIPCLHYTKKPCQHCCEIIARSSSKQYWHT